VPDLGAEAGKSALGKILFDKHVCTIAEAAEDTKKVGDLSKSADMAVLAVLPYKDCLCAIAEALDKAVTESSILADLAKVKHSVAIQNIWKALVIAKGDDKFNKLSPEEQANFFFFLPGLAAACTKT
jgi:hypothetical protein